MKSPNFMKFCMTCEKLVRGAILLYALHAATLFAQEAEPIKSTPKRVSNDLVGVWESPKTTKGGLGTIYEFREDGGWVGTIGALVDVKGGVSASSRPRAAAFSPQDQAQKVMEGADGSEVWKYRHYTGGFAYERFLLDGRSMLRVPFPVPWGMYEVKGKSLRLLRPNCPAVIVSYRIKGNTLELTAKGKSPQRLVRVQPTWYHALTADEVEEAKEGILKAQQELQNKLEKNPEKQGTENYEILR